MSTQSFTSPHTATARRWPGRALSSHWAPLPVVLADWRGHLLHRLARELQLTGDAELADLYEEMPGTEHAPDANAIMAELHIKASDGAEPLRFFSTITVFGTAADITVSELSVEAFFPADPETAERLRTAS
jgi:hypothetical protein